LCIRESSEGGGEGEIELVESPLKRSMFRRPPTSFETVVGLKALNSDVGGPAVSCQRSLDLSQFITPKFKLATLTSIICRLLSLTVASEPLE
jgi:hypothetical protein